MLRRILSTATLLLLSATSAVAAVNMSGDVPQQGTTFGTVFVDNNSDNLSDIIDDQGNEVFDFLVDSDNPAGSVDGLAWDDPAVWVDYETDQNILVGQTGPGSLEINQGSALRYQHLVLGGLSSTGFQGNMTFMGADLDLQTGGTGATFDFRDQLTELDLPTTGIGVVTVTGFGSIYNNDPNLIPGNFQTALGESSFTNGAFSTPDASFRPDAASGAGGDEGYHVIVGLLGGGQLNVDSGGRVEIQDALLVGLGSSANGTVNVDGFGSSILASGRTDHTTFMGGDSAATEAVASTVGGLGSGTLNIRNGGRVDLFNGLNIGFFEDTVITNASGPRTGVVTVDGSQVGGSGSLLNIYNTTVTSPPSITLADIPDTTNNPIIATLAIGSQVGTAASDRGIGTLNVRSGAVVNVQVTDGYDEVSKNDITRSNAGIGINSTLNMEGGEINVGNILFSAGNITGYGDIRANTIYNGTLQDAEAYAEIIASNAPGQRLSIVLDGDPTDTMVDNQGDFRNRGDVSGNVDLSAPGAFYNDGNLNANGTFITGTFYNSSRARGFDWIGRTSRTAIFCKRSIGRQRFAQYS